MTGAEATAAVIDALETMSFRYMLVGSLSSNVFGIPRSTKDADFVIQSGGATLPELVSRLGPSFRLEPQERFETITMTTRQIVHIDEIPFIVEFWSTQGQRSKDVDDARGIVAVQGDRLDLNYIREWCERHDTSALLDEIRRSIPTV